MEGAGGSKEGDEDDGGAEKNKSIEDARPLKSADSIDAGLIMDAGTILSNGSKAEADSKMTADMAEDSGLSDSMLSLVLFAVGWLTLSMIRPDLSVTVTASAASTTNPRDYRISLLP